MAARNMRPGELKEAIQAGIARWKNEHPQDDQKIRDAFKIAVEKRTDADKPCFLNPEGQPTTPRQIIDGFLAKDSFLLGFKGAVEPDPAEPIYSVDGIVHSAEAFVGAILGSSPKAPKSGSPKP